IEVFNEGTSSHDAATTAVGTAPHGIAFNPNSGFIYVANSGSANVSVLGVPFLAESVIGSPIKVGDSPEGVAVNPTTNRVYVANNGGGANAVSVIDGAGTGNGGAGTIVGSPISAVVNPFSVAVNPITNRVYVANNLSAVSVIDGAGTGSGGA